MSCRFVKATTLRLLQERPIRSFKIGMLKSITVFFAEGEVFATQGHCVHMHAPLLAARLEGKTISCSWHNWRYDVASGRCLTNTWAKLTTYPVKVEGEEVYVGLPEETAVEKLSEDWEMG